MKIGLISNTDGALFRFRGEIIKHLRDSGHIVSGYASLDSAEGCYRRELDELCNLYWPHNIRSTFIPSMLGWLSITRQIVNSKEDLLFGYGHVANLFTVLGGKLSKGKVFLVVTGIGRMGDNFLGRVFLKLFYSICMLLGATVVFLNEDDFSDLVSKRLAKFKNRSMIMYGEGCLERASVSIQRKEGAYSFLYAGRFMIEKGIGEFLFCAERMSDCNFYIAGYGSNNIETRIKRLAERKANIHFLSFVQNMDEVYDRIDCLVLPTYYNEGLPRSLMEACREGKAVITTKGRGCETSVNQGVNGFLVSKADSESLQEALMKIRELDRNKVAKESRRLYEEKFSIKKTFEFYDKLILRDAN